MTAQMTGILETMTKLLPPKASPSGFTLETFSVYCRTGNEMKFNPPEKEVYDSNQCISGVVNR